MNSDSFTVIFNEPKTTLDVRFEIPFIDNNGTERRVGEAIVNGLKQAGYDAFLYVKSVRYTCDMVDEVA